MAVQPLVERCRAQRDLLPPEGKKTIQPVLSSSDGVGKDGRLCELINGYRSNRTVQCEALSVAG